MSKLQEYLLEKRQEEAYLIEDSRSRKSKDDYIVNAEVGSIIAFRLNFESNDGTALTKVISGKVIENDNGESKFIVETRNGLKYGVPYSAVVWVKTGDRWPKGVFEEMKQGAVLQFEDDDIEDLDEGTEEDYVEEEDSDEEDFEDDELEDDKEL